MAGIVIVGGKLQGSEAAYLGKQAGIDIILIDTDPDAPAQKLCSEFICADVLGDDPAVRKALDEADMILPTMENDEVLEGLTKLCHERGYVLAFDMEAYRTTSSKRASDRLFADNNLPCPRYYPEGTFPYFTKPNSESGSHGARLFEDSEEGRAAFAQFEAAGGTDEFIVQEFVTGPSYSVEIIGRPGNYRTYEITQIFVDDVYDCNNAAAYRTIDPRKAEEISDYAVAIAEVLGLEGIMDLEVIDTRDGLEYEKGGMKILEIDARIPSQTAVAVYKATGMNYVKELYDLFVHGDFQDEMRDLGKYASYRQFLVTRDAKAGTRIECLGEHIMVEGGLLEYDDRFDWADCMSDFADVMRDCDEAGQWRGIFISWADSLEELNEKEERYDEIDN